MTPQDMIKAGRFVKNNGIVLRNINMMHHQYLKLSDIKYVLADMPENEYTDSINYLSESGYIKLRHIKTKQIVDIADVDYNEIESKLTKKGINLLLGYTTDEAVSL